MSITQINMFSRPKPEFTFFRGIVEDEAAMLAFPDIEAGQYLGRIDTGTIWKYDGSVFTDTLETFTFSSILNLENEVDSIIGNVASVQDTIQAIVDTRVYENSATILNTNAEVYADGQRGYADPTGESAGWYFKNSNDLTNKVNWYYIGNLNPQAEMTFTTLDRIYAVVDLRGGTELPFFTIYSKRENDGNDVSWYRSRKVFANYGDFSGLIGQTVLLHVGDATNIFPSLPRIELTLDVATSNGLQGANEEILFGAFSTSTGYAQDTFDFVANTLGYINDGNRMDYDLMANPSDLPPPGPSYAATHYVSLDATNDYLDLAGTGSALDYLGNWSLGITLEDVSPIDDNSFIVLYKSGSNLITLRKGGSNWGIYCFAGGNSVAQANTWIKPSPGSKVLIQCNGTVIQYYLDGVLRANMTMNSNKNSTAHVVGELDVGRGGVSTVYGAANYWYGGLDNLFVSPDYMGAAAIAEYFASDDVSVMSFYDDITDFCTLGEGVYPAVDGLKAVITGDLINGTSSDFVER